MVRLSICSPPTRERRAPAPATAPPPGRPTSSRRRRPPSRAPSRAWSEPPGEATASSRPPTPATPSTTTRGTARPATSIARPPSSSGATGTSSDPTAGPCTRHGPPVAVKSSGLAVELAAELRHLGRALVPCLLHDPRGGGVGGEALEALRIPVEADPDPIALVGIAKDRRALGPMLLALLRALGREDLDEAVEILDLRRQQNQMSHLRGERRALRIAPRIGLVAVGARRAGSTLTGQGRSGFD